MGISGNEEKYIRRYKMKLLTDVKNGAFYFQFQPQTPIEESILRDIIEMSDGSHSVSIKGGVAAHDYEETVYLNLIYSIGDPESELLGE